MRTKISGNLVTVLFLLNWGVPCSAQSPSDYALIRLPVFENPTTWKLTRQFANDSWGVDRFHFPVSGAASYVASPSYVLFSGVSFHLDRSWNRIIYHEALDGRSGKVGA